MKTPGQAEDGWALVSVLWVVAILTMLAAATQALTLTSNRLEARALQRAEVQAALNAGVVRAVLGISARSTGSRWPVDGTPQSFTFSGYHMKVTVEDEAGKIDLNAADESVLRQLLKNAGLSNQSAAALTDEILDWRSATHLHRLHGATDADYAAIGHHYRQRHGLFQSVDELKLVMGMAPTLFAKIRPALTVYSHRPTIDTNLASRQTLLAYYGGDTDHVDRILAARTSRGTESSSLQFPTDQGAPSAIYALTGHAFTITVSAHAGSQRFTRHAVLLFTGKVQRPYLTLSWR